MKNKDFSTTIVVDQTPEEVFNAIINVPAWWHGEIKGSAKKLNDEFEYRYQEFHYSKQKVVELVPNKKVVWLVTDSQLNFIEDKTEWTGTKIVFDITAINGKTQLCFTHEGLTPSVECYKDCSNGWSMLIQKSLFSLLTKGKGREVFN